MSAIGGRYHFDGRLVDHASLTQMMDCVPRRGPDGMTVWSAGAIGVGHRMLRTTPESLIERQPLMSEDGGLVLTADARVDNREELRGDLEAHGFRLRSDTDAELILRAYERWGEECPERIVGDFAFAIWDARRRSLFCARDPLGVKPFHYYADARRFVWASEPRQILADPAIPLAPNLRAIGRVLLQRGYERDQTLYDGICRLLPGHSAIVDRKGIRVRRYWDLDPTREVRYRRNAEYAEHFRSLFDEAVRCRLRSCGPLSAFLSGGLDSSSIVCVAQHLYREGRAVDRGFETFSMLFESLACDERHYIDEVVGKYDLRASFINFASEGSAIDVNRALEHPGVLYDPTTYACFPLLRAAHDRGSRACLWGVGGDEVLTAGSNYLGTLLRHGRIGPLASQLRHTASVCGVSTWKLAWHYCVRPLIPNAVKAPFRPISRRFRRDELPSWITPRLLTGLNERVATTDKPFRSASQRELYGSLVSGWQADMLLGHVDAMGAAHSIEPRHPFLDRRLVEFAMQVPEKQKIGVGQTKALLRNAVRDAMPDKIANRVGKSAFTQANDWALRNRHASAVECLLTESKLADMGMVDRHQIIMLFDRYRRDNSRRDLQTMHRECSAIWTVVRLELWLQTVSTLEKKRQAYDTVEQVC